MLKRRRVPRNAVSCLGPLLVFQTIHIVGLRGSCDICRRQKIRCDSAKMPGNRCSNCIAFNSDCTHNLSQVKVGSRASPVRPPSYLSHLAHLRKQKAQYPVSSSSCRAAVETPKDIVDGFIRQTYSAPETRDALLQLLLEISRYARGLEQEVETSRHVQSPQSSTTAVSPPADDPEPADEPGIIMDIQKLPDYLKRITMDAANHRFFGKNSSVMFVKHVMETVKGSSPRTLPRMTRPKYWTPVPWEARPDPVVILTFPPTDLLHDLVDIYFKQINIYTFVLHRPSFEKLVADSLHTRDNDFGMLVLAVCALASKNSADKRVLLPCEHGELSAGWEWFRQIRRPFSGPVVKTASLHQLQLCCLYIAFQQMGSDIEGCWLLCGTGILQAQDIGAHRLITPSVTVEDEMLKRACFYLSVIDSIASACFGRPRVSVPGECDLSRPVNVDDEYWDNPDPKLMFKQPEGKPALSLYYNAYISLVKIFTFSWRNSGPPQDYTGTRPLEADTVAELDTRLDEWAANIPEHLLWNPYQENEIFFEQSSGLYGSFYHLQILIHRPFIQHKSASTVRSLAICTNAARSCSTIADVKSRRGFTPGYHLIKAVFDSAIVLLLNITGATRSGLDVDTDRELVDVYKCMTLLKQTEPRWQNAGRFYDCLCEVLNASNLPLPPISSPEIVPSKLSYDTSYERGPAPAANAGGRPAPESWPDSLLSLPMAVDDLGSLPIYGSLNELGLAEMDKSLLAGADFIGGLSYQPLLNGSLPTMQSMDTDYYLSHWMPYLSSLDGVTHGMGTQFAS
ncbi:fungal-trans domain-containing protein [Favolaschia claudopus]|uniref:Fungal-trans domain-containing protein n=1 Tax=Favolaschia claudopus TaxID=2862362 RepID=A0AAW0CGG1_9AGAR